MYQYEVRSIVCTTITIPYLNIFELTVNVRCRESDVTGQALKDAASGGINRIKNQTHFHVLQHMAI